MTYILRLELLYEIYESSDQKHLDSASEGSGFFYRTQAPTHPSIYRKDTLQNPEGWLKFFSEGVRQNMTSKLILLHDGTLTMTLWITKEFF